MTEGCYGELRTGAMWSTPNRPRTVPSHLQGACLAQSFALLICQATLCALSLWVRRWGSQWRKRRVPPNRPLPRLHFIFLQRCTHLPIVVVVGTSPSRLRGASRACRRGRIALVLTFADCARKTVPPARAQLQNSAQGKQRILPAE